MDIAEQSLIDLKNGAILVIKLPTGYKKIKAIDKILKQSNKENTRQRLSSMKQEEINENLTFQHQLMLGLKEHYKFTPIIAVFDSTYDALLVNKDISGVFYDVDLKKLDSFSLKMETFYTFRLDQVFYDAGKSHTAFVITNSKGEQLKFPFPFEIPYKFRRESVLPAKKPDFLYFNIFTFGLRGIGAELIKKRKEQKMEENGGKAYYKRLSWWKMDEDHYVAVAKMLELKLSYFDAYINERKGKSN
jgi:hypothetical protein